MKYILIIIAIISLASCRTVKNSQTVETKDNSFELKLKEDTIRLLKEETAALRQHITMLSDNVIVFEDEPCDTIIQPPNKVDFNIDGTIKSAEGRIKSINAKYLKEQQTAFYWKNRYDSAVNSKQIDQKETIKETVTITKTVKRTVLPWWLILVAAGVLIVGWRLGKVR